MGAAYIVRKRARFVSINGPVNLRYGTPVDAVDGFLVHNGRPLCAVTSESAIGNVIFVLSVSISSGQR